ncbi:hypothetical protein TWF481_011011 [Arthrobotrys musiformis]|uniref:F-box domain-containing protein n=1 Tax=Arthrobotrys musiformis TaxID=47236 RepID=A0AAV9VX80_9PEZI
MSLSPLCRALYNAAIRYRYRTFTLQIPCFRAHLQVPRWIDPTTPGIQYIRTLDIVPCDLLWRHKKDPDNFPVEFAPVLRQITNLRVLKLRGFWEIDKCIYANEIVVRLLWGNENIRELEIVFGQNLFTGPKWEEALWPVRKLKALSFYVMWPTAEHQVDSQYSHQLDYFQPDTVHGRRLGRFSGYYNFIWDFLSRNSKTLRSLHFQVGVMQNKEFLQDFFGPKPAPNSGNDKSKDSKPEFGYCPEPFFIPEKLTCLSLDFLGDRRFKRPLLYLLRSDRLANLKAFQLLSHHHHDTLVAILMCLPPLKILSIGQNHEWRPYLHSTIAHLRPSLEVLYFGSVILPPNKRPVWRVGFRLRWWPNEGATDFSDWPKLRELALPMGSQKLLRLIPPPNLQRFRILEYLASANPRMTEAECIVIAEEIGNRQIQLAQSNAQAVGDAVDDAAEETESTAPCAASTPAFKVLLNGEDRQYVRRHNEAIDLQASEVDYTPTEGGLVKASIRPVTWDSCSDSCILGEQAGPWSWIGRPERGRCKFSDFPPTTHAFWSGGQNAAIGNVGQNATVGTVGQNPTVGNIGQNATVGNIGQSATVGNIGLVP